MVPPDQGEMPFSILTSSYLIIEIMNQMQYADK